MAITSTNAVGPIHGRQIVVSSVPVLQGQGLLGQAMTATGQDSSDQDGDAREQWHYKWQRSADGVSNWQDSVTGSAPVVPGYTIVGADLNQYLRLCLTAEAEERSFPVATKLSDEVCSTVSALIGNVTLSIDDPGVLTVTENQTWMQPLVATSNITNPALQWSLEGEDAALFDIDAGTGALSLKASQDFENPADADKDNVYKITVRVTDTASNTEASKDLALTVTDVDEDMQGSWTVTTDNAVADGATTNVLIFTLTDGVNPVVGETVNISSLQGATLTPTTGVTNDSGQIQITVAHTVAESVTVTVSWEDAGQTDSASQAVSFTVDDVIDVTTDGGVLIVDGNNVAVTGNPVVDITLHSRVTLQGESSPASFDRTKTPSGKNITYQWQRRDSQGGGTWEDIPTATGVTYQVLGADQGYEFRVDANVQP